MKPGDVIQTILPAILTFCVGIASAPFLANWLYRNKLWKKNSVAKTISGEASPITSKLHNDETRKTPRMGGILVWGSTAIVVLGLALLDFLTGNQTIEQLSFLSRSQTWLPFATLIVMSLIGAIDDYLVCMDRGTYHGGGLSLRARVALVSLVGLVGAIWFYTKLDVSSIFIPTFGDVNFGIFFIPIFIIFMVGLYSGGIIDGVDGLSGGVFGIMYGAYAIIAYSNGQIDLAAFCMALCGGLLAFLWFNIPPARFFLSETGSMGLTTTLVVIAFLTHAVFVLPIIALPLIVTTLSTIIQLLSKKFRNGKKVFLVAPLHNHFQAIGWPAYKVTMRYWIISFLCAITGVIIILIK
jgi:phospho-N-acetylmuramoyl-pentapeptide-transferase